MIQPRRELRPLNSERTRWNVTIWPIFGGGSATMELEFTEKQYDSWQKGEGFIQNLMPQLSAEQREFLISGTTPEQWAEMFKPKWHASITPERVMESVKRRHMTLDDPGFCIACGADAAGCEPDACEYKCISCGEMKVYADEELLMEIAL